MKILKSAYKVFSLIVTAILVFILAANIYVIVNRQLFGNKYPTVFGCSTAVVVSGSMQPEININDMVIIKAQDKYKKGDVISFINGTSLVTHRIAEITSTGFVTKGDANNTEDKTEVTKDQIMGKVVHVLPGAGNVISFLQSPLGMLLLIITAFILLEIPNLSVKKAKESEDDTKDEEKNK